MKRSDNHLFGRLKGSNAVQSLVGRASVGLGVALVLVGATLQTTAEEPSAKASELIGKKASEWEVTDWMHSEPIELKDLRGNVVLVRWWTGPGCPYCTSSAPALNEWYRQYHSQGLNVIGLYHHKARFPLSKQWVRTYAEERLGFKFPIAIDPEWATLKDWWLSTGDRDWTSVTFLLDRDGIIRFIHPGGKYEKGDAVYRKLHATIQSLLAEDVER